MTKKSYTKKALITSIFSLLICSSMLLGTTFAWFTDTVTSANNIIKSGTLDVELYYQAEGETGWTKVDENTNVFMPDALWEPGHTEVVKLKVVNEGTLALKYQLGVNVAGEDGSVNVNDVAFKVSDYIKYGIVDGAKNYTREEAIAAVDATATAIMTAWNSEVIKLLVDDAATTDVKENEKIVTMVVYMPTTVGNEANPKKGAPTPTINLGINLFATQVENEADSFGNDYDAGTIMKPAESWDGTVAPDMSEAKDETAKVLTISTAEQLAALAAEVNAGNSYAGWTVKLAANIDLCNKPWTPIGTDLSKCFSAMFDGNGYTVYNLNVTSVNNAGLIGYAANGGDVKNLTVENATVSGNDYAGAIMGRGYTTIVDCHVKNATVTVTPFLTSDGVTYDGGAKAGGIIGQLLEGAGNGVEGCTATNVYVKGYRDLGGVVGMIHNNNYAKDCSATNVTIEYNAIVGAYDGNTPNQNAGAIYGRKQPSATVEISDEANGNFTLVVATYVNNAADLQAAISAGRNIILTDDITVTTPLTMNRTCTVDLNGNTLYMCTTDDSPIGGAANVTIKNGNVDISGVNFTEHNGIFNFKGNTAGGNTLTIDNVNFYGDGFTSYSVFWIAEGLEGTPNTLNLVNSKFELKNEAYESGGFIKHPSSVANYKSAVNITNTVLDFENITRLFLYGAYNIKDSEIIFADTTGTSNGLRQGQFIIDNSKITISGGDKGISPRGTDTVIKNGSVVTINNVTGKDVVFEYNYDILVDSTSTFTYNTVSGTAGGTIIVG